MINISLANGVSCENLCKKIDKEINTWIGENGKDLSDCFINISILKVAHTINHPESYITLTHVDHESN